MAANPFIAINELVERLDKIEKTLGKVLKQHNDFVTYIWRGLSRLPSGASYERGSVLQVPPRPARLRRIHLNAGEGGEKG